MPTPRPNAPARLLLPLAAALLGGCPAPGSPKDDTAPDDSGETADTGDSGGGGDSGDGSDPGDSADTDETGDTDCTPVTVYADRDEDTWGDDDLVYEGCDPPSGWIARGGDCDDDDNDVHPGADEHCDGEDDDCDGVADDAAVDAPPWYRDRDGDGWGDGVLTEACEPPKGGVPRDGDCDDANSAVNPGAEEVCDNADNDCDGAMDDAPVDGVAAFHDGDGDGHGNPAEGSTFCYPPSDWPLVGDDCDDADPTVFPGAPELCDGVPNDCDAPADWAVEDEAGTVTWTDPHGNLEDATADWAAGTEAAPAALELLPGTWRVCAGTWYVHAVATGEVVIEGGAPAEEVVLDGGGAGRILESGDPLEVRTLGFRNGGDGDDGGALLHTGGELLVEGCSFADNLGSFGGAVSVQHAGSDSAAVTLTDLVFSGNRGRRGGALYVEIGGELVGAGLSFTDDVASASGGSFAIEDGGAVTLDEVSIDGSSADGDGGGLYVDIDAASDVTMSRVDIVGTVAGGDGGGLRIATSGDVLLHDVHVDEARALGNGGGAWLLGDDVELDAFTTDGSSCTGDGGGTYLYADTLVASAFGAADNEAGVNGHGGGMRLDVLGDLRAEDGELSGNSAAAGGGLYLEDLGEGGAAVFTGVSWTGNTADDGGGAWVSHNAVSLLGCGFHENTAEEAGGGLWMSSEGALTFGEGSVFWDNTSAADGGGLYLAAGSVSCEGGAKTAEGFLRNVAVTGGAVYLRDTEGTLSFTASSCDLGVDADDNLGGDVWTAADGGTSWSWGDDASFTCDREGCG